MRIFLISIFVSSFYGFTNCDLAENSDKVVIIDDIFATSGTIRASMKLIKKTKKTQ